MFQYERRIPIAIQRDTKRFEETFKGQALFRRSLRTKKRDEAVLAYGAVDAQFEALLGRKCGIEVRPKPNREDPRRTLTDHDLTAIADRYEMLTAGPFERLHRRANVCPIAAADLERMESDLELDADQIRDAVRSRSDGNDSAFLRPASEANLLIDEIGYFAPAGSENRGAIIGAVRSGMERGYRRIAALSTGDVAPRLDDISPSSSIAGTITLADAVRRYIEVRKLPAKALSEINLALGQFEQVVGRMTLAAIRREDVYDFIEYLSNQTVGGKTAGSVIRPLSEQSIRKRCRLLGSSVNFARDRELFSGENPFSNIRFAGHVRPVDKAIMPDKRRFRISELNTIFAHPWFTGCESETKPYKPGSHRLRGEHFWVPIVALFTGCRAGELGGMKLSEVRLDDPHPHFIVRDNEYRRTKSRRARSVPILDALLNMGFAEYVVSINDGKNDRLFPKWTAPKRKGATESDDPAWSNSGVVRAFNRHVIPNTLGANMLSGARSDVTFHSFRGSFKAMVGKWPNVPSLIYDEVVGHKQSELNERYIGEVTIEETYPVMRNCNFQGLNLPVAPPLPN